MVDGKRDREEIVEEIDADADVGPPRPASGDEEEQHEGAGEDLAGPEVPKPKKRKVPRLLRRPGAPPPAAAARSCPGRAAARPGSTAPLL